MLNDTLLLGFLAAALVVLLLPGPGVVYVVARSITQGRRAGFVSVLGLSAGALVHVAAATAGLSIILLTSALAFEIVKAVGAAYLIYLGVRMLLTKQSRDGKGSTLPPSSKRLFVDGAIVSLFNPKIAVFFLAFLPQFVDPALGAILAQILVLGLIYVVLALITDGAYALLAGGVRHLLSGKLIQSSVPRYLCGWLYIGLGVNAALTGRPR